jgi:hypothetical protein
MPWDSWSARLYCVSYASDDVVSPPENHKKSKSHKDEHHPAASSHQAAVSVLFHFKPLRLKFAAFSLATIRSAAGKGNPAYNDATTSFSGFDCRTRNMTSPKCDDRLGSRVQVLKLVSHIRANNVSLNLTVGFFNPSELAPSTRRPSAFRELPESHHPELAAAIDLIETCTPHRR